MRKEEVEVWRAGEKGDNEGSAQFLLPQEVPQGGAGQEMCRSTRSRRAMLAQAGFAAGAGGREQPCWGASTQVCKCKREILRLGHVSLHFPLASLRSGEFDPYSPHLVSCPWKALFSHFLIYFKAHRQKQKRQLSADEGRKAIPWETV